MNDNANDYLSRPLTVQPRQPIRIAAYSRLASGIRNGILPAGTLLPKESELAEMLEVSRTPIREALILLEEDGLITTKRGVGRFVAESLPEIGLEKIRPFEERLDVSPARVEITTDGITSDPATEFASSHLKLDVGAMTWFRESVLSQKGHPLAIVQEHIPAELPGPIGKELNRIARNQGDDNENTILGVLLRSSNIPIDAGECHIHVSEAGKTRSSRLKTTEDEPVLILTQIATHHGTPIYLGKYIVKRTTGDFCIMQSVM